MWCFWNVGEIRDLEMRVFIPNINRYDNIDISKCCEEKGTRKEETGQWRVMKIKHDPFSPLATTAAWVLRNASGTNGNQTNET